MIQARNNNIGNGNLYAEGRLNPVPGVADVNECAEPELHDCDPDASRYLRLITQFSFFHSQMIPHLKNHNYHKR